MKTFHYPLNHKKDEAYMAEMRAKGWAAVRLVEGVWTFEPCRPNQYTYRVAYLRGKSREAVQALKRDWAKQEIEFVSQYVFWAILRSEHDFQLYTPDEEISLCERIRRPMLAGAVLSGIGAAVVLALAIRLSEWFGVPAFLCAAYAGICASLALSYTNLLRRMRQER